MQKQLTQSQVAVARKAVAQVKPAKAKAGTPKYLVRFAVNRERRHVLAEVMREEFGLKPQGALWAKAKSQVKIA